MRKKKKKATRKKTTTKRRVSRKRVIASPVVKKRKRRVSPMAKKTKRRKSAKSSISSNKKPMKILENVAVGVGAFLLSFVGSKFIENKLLKVGASALPVALSYFGMPQYLLPVSVGSGISAVILGFQGYASPELKTQVTEWTGLTLGQDGDVFMPEETARLLLGAYRKALSGNSNGTPLGADSNGSPLGTYVVGASQYVVSGTRSASPLQ